MVKKKSILFFYNQRYIIRFCSKMNYAYTRVGNMVITRRQKMPGSDIYRYIDWIRVSLDQ